jgi:transcriptional regulator with XRE-family HTH domain
MAHGIIPAMVTFGKAVRAFRMAKGCTQEYLAQTINYSKAWLSNLETGQLRPERKVVIAIEKPSASRTRPSWTCTTSCRRRASRGG